MDNQHRKITGYRELSQADIDLMNKVKSLGVQMASVIAEIDEHQKLQRRLAHNDDVPEARSTEQQRLDVAQPERWLAMGCTDLQTGLMKLTRAVAQPGFF